MKRCIVALALATTFAAAGCGNDSPSSPGPTVPAVTFFVSSQKSTTGNLGGLRGADGICQNLAASIGAGSKTWRAYLSVERDPDNNNQPTHARNRIGNGPWVNVQGAIIAQNLNELHSRAGDAALFLDERGQRINGQWTGSPSPIQHDILTGSNADGTVAAGLTCADWSTDSSAVAAQVGHSDGMLMAGFTCSDWTSSAASFVGQVGHSDGMGPNQSTTGTLASWNSAHANQDCSNTAPRGGAGRIYCFAR